MKPPETISSRPKSSQSSISSIFQFLKVKVNYYLETFNGKQYVTLYDKDRNNIIIDNYPYHKWLNDIARYSYAGSEVLTYTEGYNKGDTYYRDYLITNMRALLNAGIPYEKIPYNKEGLGKYGVRAVKIKAPMFVFNQLMTHTAFSKEARSERVTKLDPNDFWLPPDFEDKLSTYMYKKFKDERSMFLGDYRSFVHIEDERSTTIIERNTDGSYILKDIAGIRDVLTNELSQNSIRSIFKDIGYKNEIAQRAMLELRYKEWVMVGTMKDSSTWEHLFLERNATDVYDNWTQEETRLVVKTIKEAFEDVENTRLGETNLLTEEDVSNLVLQSSGKLDISDYVNDINDRKS